MSLASSSSSSSAVRRSASQRTLAQLFGGMSLSRSTASAPSRRRALSSSAYGLQASPMAAATGEEAAAAVAPATWKPTSRRVGLIAFKRGMTSFFLPSGERVPATLLQVAANRVSAHVGFNAVPGTPAAAYTALQVAAVDPTTASQRGITKQIKGHLAKAGIGAKKVIKEFKVSKDALVPLGAHLSAHHFVPGQAIDVRAITRGKGYQGTMKRHGFHGLRASHGVSISHRSAGSTGQHQDPGRVFPGKKMAGRMGGTAHRTVQNLRVLRIDDRMSTVLVEGAVPGPEGGIVTLTDAKKGLVGKAANAWQKGKVLDGSLASGSEPAAAYLPNGIQTLPFPAATREMAAGWPAVVEVGLEEK